MKLTESGLNRLVENTTRCSMDGSCSVRPIGSAQVYALKSFDFRSDDFVGAVVLTVEEAKVIASFFGAVDACCDLRMSKTEQKTWCKLNKRIKKAEC